MESSSRWQRWLVASGGSLLVASAVMIGSAGADTAELHPGVLEGQVSLNGEAIDSVQASASSTDGSSYSSGNFTGGSYSLTVEGDLSYRPVVDARINEPSGNSFLRISRNTGVFVPVGGTSTSDFSYDSSRVDATIDVVGGQVTTVYLYATATGTDESYYARRYDYTTASSKTISFPMIANPSVRVYGTAYLVSDTGLSVTRPLAATYIAVDATGGQVSWSFDLSDLDTNSGSISGVVEVVDPAGFGNFSQHRLSFYGYDSVTSGIAKHVYETANGVYSASNLLAGVYYSYGYTYFQAPYGVVTHPYPGSDWSGTLVSVAAGDVVTRDFSVDVGRISSSTVFTGFADNSIVAVGYAYATGVGDALGANASIAVAADGSYDMVAAAGDHALYSDYALFQDYSDPATPLRSYFSRSDYSQHPSYGGTPVTVSAGQTLAVAPREIETVETAIVLDVIEAPGLPEADISNPYVQLSGSRYSDTGGWIGSTYITAYGPSTTQAQQTVRIVGEPGDYSVTVWATVNGSQVRFATFPMTLQDPLDTPTGSDVPVEPADGITMVFDNVIEGGVTTVTESPIGPEAPSGFRVLSPGGDATYYDISTTAVFDGQVLVCLDYDDTGLSGAQENALQLSHYVTEPGPHWENITAAGYPDIANNVICGYTDSFSVFAVMAPHDTDGDGVLGHVDNCPDDANAGQEDLDGDGLGDVCDDDDDNDGIPDDLDDCTASPGDEEYDNDGDGMFDVCDPDDDNDEIADELDNCPLVANGGQVDFDGDGAGDACDDDDDADGVLDTSDTCAETPAGEAIDSAGCSSAQRLANACPVDGSYKNHGAYVRCVAHEGEAQVEIGLITEEQKDAMVAEAAGSDIGKKDDSEE